MADWQVVRTVGTEEEAALIAGRLEAGGIESAVESLLFHQEPVTFGRLGEVRVLVAAGDLAEAERLLAAEAEKSEVEQLDDVEELDREAEGDAGAARDVSTRDQND